MVIKDTIQGYGLVTRLLHWGFAVAIVALFALGWWMVELDYYSPYYNSAPYWHKAVGIILLILLVPRFLWRLINVKPSDDELKPLERKASALVHWGFYPLLLALTGQRLSYPDRRRTAHRCLRLVQRAVDLGV